MIVLKIFLNIFKTIIDSHSLIMYILNMFKCSFLGLSKNG